MSEVVAMPGVTIEQDVEREYVEWFKIHWNKQVEAHGEPIGVAVVFIGEDNPDSGSHVTCWSMRKRSIGSRMAATAAMLLQAWAIKKLNG